VEASFQALLTKKLSHAIEALFPGRKGEEAEVVQSSQESFGHYQCNSCLKIAKTLKLNPREVANSLKDFLLSDSTSKELFSKIEVAGPGFLNMTLSSNSIEAQVKVILKDKFLGVQRPIHKQKIIVEFSSPNVAKELHVGHLRSTIIGDAIARIFEFLGHDVLRLNHIGDWGTQFGMLITYLKDHHEKVLQGEESTDLTSLMNWYKASKKKFDEDPDFKKRSQLQVVKLQSGDEESLSAWKRICEISRVAFQEIYDLMDIKTEERGESFYNPYLANLVKELEEKGVVTTSNGAKCIFLEGINGRDGAPLPMIIQKSDGGFNYDTTDMAALKHRIEEEKAERIVILTDAGQSLHFQMLFQAGLKAGYYDPAKLRLDHVTFGVVLGPDGKKFKTRSGETEKLIDLLLEAVSKAKLIIDERLPDVSEGEKTKIAKALGIGAVKYADLSGNRVKDYVFSYDRMLKFEGNTASFLLYAFVRIQGIKRKGHWDIANLIEEHPLSLSHPSEILLALHLCQLPEVLEIISRDLLPNRLSDYLYTLAEKFNAFYRDCRVEGAEEEKSRILLCEATGRVLEKGLNLLGLSTVSRM
jgi:arginyl-tRNA synthetase